MAVNVRGVDRDQLLLMPPSVREWLPEGHLAFFVLDVVDELDLSAFLGAYREDGRGGAVYDRGLMLAVHLYAYCTGERSSRRIERRLVEDVAYRVLAANQHPDHATLARFRRRHQDAIAGLFGQVLGLCVKAGIVDAGLVAIDGTKVEANASFFANRKKDELEALAARILAEAEEVDAAEDEQFGERRGDELPAEWAGGRDRRSRIRAALEELDRQTARDYESRMAERAAKEAALGHRLSGPQPTSEPARRKSPRKANTTDPHSRIIATGSQGVLQGYNAQAAATQGQVVVAAEVTVTTNDQPHFTPMATAVNENLSDAGHQGGVGVFVADAGYWSTDNANTDVNADVLIATRKSSWRTKDKLDDDKLSVLAKVNRGELSHRQAGEVLGVSYTWIGDMVGRYFSKEGQRLARTAEPEPEEWLPVIERHERGEINQRQAMAELEVSQARVKTMLAHVRGELIDPSVARTTMDAKLAEPHHAASYRKRQHSIEPVFGNIKGNLGYRRFSLRGLDAVQSEWRLICSARLGRVRFQIADRPNGMGTVDWACEVIAPGSTIHTDGTRSLRRLANLGYSHTYVKGYESADISQELPGVHLVASLLKRWITGTLQYRVSDKHLAYYLDEFAFRVNRRTSTARGLLFYRLLQQAVNTDPHPLAALIRSE